MTDLKILPELLDEKETTTLKVAIAAARHLQHLVNLLEEATEEGDDYYPDLLGVCWEVEDIVGHLEGIRL